MGAKKLVKTQYKNSTHFTILKSILEVIKGINLETIILKKKINNFLYKGYFFIKPQREVCNCVYKDMLHLVLMWRQIRGYPSKGNTTHTNAKTSRKNKLLFQYRLQQFNTLFGVKKRNIYPTLIKAEYNNRLWFYNWSKEWFQASIFVKIMVKTQKRHGGFNPVVLANNQTNGYTRIGAASKIGKAKKLTQLFTIGVPILFTRFIYYEKLPKDFPERLLLKDEVNKKLGKKLKRKVYKK